MGFGIKADRWQSQRDYLPVYTGMTVKLTLSAENSPMLVL